MSHSARTVSIVSPSPRKRAASQQTPDTTTPWSTAESGKPKRIIKRNRKITSCFECREKKQKCDRVHPVCGECAAIKGKCTYVSTIEEVEALRIKRQFQDRDTGSEAGDDPPHKSLGEPWTPRLSSGSDSSQHTRSATFFGGRYHNAPTTVAEAAARNSMTAAGGAGIAALSSTSSSPMFSSAATTSYPHKAEAADPYPPYSAQSQQLPPLADSDLFCAGPSTSAALLQSAILQQRNTLVSDVRVRAARAEAVAEVLASVKISLPPLDAVRELLNIFHNRMSWFCDAALPDLLWPRIEPLLGWWYGGQQGLPADPVLMPLLMTMLAIGCQIKRTQDVSIPGEWGPTCTIVEGCSSEITMLVAAGMMTNSLQMTCPANWAIAYSAPLDLVRVCLLRALWHVGEHNLHFATTMMGSTMKLAQSAGLHRDPSHWEGLQPEEAYVRRNLWHNLVFFEVFMSNRVGQPPCVMVDWSDTRIPTDYKDLKSLYARLPVEAGTGARPSAPSLSFFQFHRARFEMARLCLNQNSQFFALKSPSKEMINRLSTDYENWREDLPSVLRFAGLKGASISGLAYVNGDTDMDLYDGKRRNGDPDASNDSPSDRLTKDDILFCQRRLLELTFLAGQTTLYRSNLEPVPRSEHARLSFRRCLTSSHRMIMLVSEWMGRDPPFVVLNILAHHLFNAMVILAIFVPAADPSPSDSAANSGGGGPGGAAGEPSHSSPVDRSGRSSPSPSPPSPAVTPATSAKNAYPLSATLSLALDMMAELASKPRLHHIARQAATYIDTIKALMSAACDQRRKDAEMRLRQQQQHQHTKQKASGEGDEGDDSRQQQQPSKRRRRTNSRDLGDRLLSYTPGDPSPVNRQTNSTGRRRQDSGRLQQDQHPQRSARSQASGQSGSSSSSIMHLGASGAALGAVDEGEERVGGHTATLHNGVSAYHSGANAARAGSGGERQYGPVSSFDFGAGSSLATTAAYQPGHNATAAAAANMGWFNENGSASAAVTAGRGSGVGGGGGPHAPPIHTANAHAGSFSGPSSASTAPAYDLDFALGRGSGGGGPPQQHHAQQHQQQQQTYPLGMQQQHNGPLGRNGSNGSIVYPPGGVSCPCPTSTCPHTDGSTLRGGPSGFSVEWLDMLSNAGVFDADRPMLQPVQSTTMGWGGGMPDLGALQQQQQQAGLNGGSGGSTAAAVAAAAASGGMGPNGQATHMTHHHQSPALAQHPLPHAPPRPSDAPPAAATATADQFGFMSLYEGMLHQQQTSAAMTGPAVNASMSAASAGPDAVGPPHAGGSASTAGVAPSYRQQHQHQAHANGRQMVSGGHHHHHQQQQQHGYSEVLSQQPSSGSGSGTAHRHPSAASHDGWGFQR